MNRRVYEVGEYLLLSPSGNALRDQGIDVGEIKDFPRLGENIPSISTSVFSKDPEQLSFDR
jgi:hypothetical protein